MTSEKRIENIESMLERLLSACSYESQVPLSLRDAALCCNVSLRWLQERVNRKEIVAYRHDVSTAWRVFPRDIKAFLTAESNQQPSRQLRVLRRA